MKIYKYMLIILIIISTGCGSSEKRKVLTIAIAANMQFAMNEIIAQFEEETNIPCQIIVASSGKLTAQITEGAPFDVFVSADMEYPMRLYETNLATAPPEAYAKGKLVLWSMVDGIDPSLDILGDNTVGQIALPNPKTAPYGKAALEVLANTQIMDNINDKLVYGESILQTNQFIISGAATVGFSTKSVVLSPQMINRGNWMEVDPAMYAPIEQGIVILKSRPMLEEAARFYTFMFSDHAIGVLDKFGYEVVKE